MHIKVGTDPETFLSRGDKFISASGLFPGTKAEPFKVKKGAVQVDGLALEFNIDPAETAEEFDDNIETVLSEMNEMVVNIDKKIKINFIPFAQFDARYFKDLPDQDKILGCDPDYNYTGKVNPSPDIMNRPFRTAAGHVHIGWTKDEDVRSPVHFADCLAVTNHFMKTANFREFSSKTYDEVNRLHYYGHSGAFRPKPYGVELRGFSNLWVKKSETRRKMFNYIKTEMNALAQKTGN